MPFDKKLSGFVTKKFRKIYALFTHFFTPVLKNSKKVVKMQVSPKWIKLNPNAQKICTSFSSRLANHQTE